MHKLVLLRHGESTWNKLGLFTGWADVDLSKKGIEEAKDLGRVLKEEGYIFDIVYTSVLKRGIRTAWIVLDELDLMWIPVKRSWRLSERHYGALQGLNKTETAAKYGKRQFLLWQRSYDIRPPALTKDDKRYPGTDPRYKDLDEKDIPLTECLKDTLVRVLPYWQNVIAPTLKSGKKVLITAHANVLRALIKYLDNISDDEMLELPFPTGMLLVYELEDDLAPIAKYCLGDPEVVRQAKLCQSK